MTTETKLDNATEYIDVPIPIQDCYAQWTQFEDFPEFMSGVDEVKQITPELLQWKTNVKGDKKEFQARITEQIPEERIAWKSTTEPTHAGVVTFHKKSDSETRITLQMDYQPEGLIEKAGSKLGVMDNQVKDSLKSFQQFIEKRQGNPTGDWQGQIERD